MTGYGQFCPVAKALEVVGERWSLLVIRELLCGNYRFGEIMHGLPLISRSVLAQRLKSLEEAGLVERHARSADGGPVYALTEAARELEPIVLGLGTWGQRWSRGKPSAKELDPVLLMWDMRRRLDLARLPERSTVVMFWYRDVPANRSRYWLRMDRSEVDLCITNPGFPVELTIETKIRTMVEIWMGQRDLRESLRDGAIQLQGTPGLKRAFPSWLLLSPFAKVERPAAAPAVV